MSKELIGRLHNLAEVFGGKCAEDCNEAADRIEELERTNQRLIMALADTEALEAGTAERCIRWRESHKLSQEQVTKKSAEIAELVELYEQALTASWPDGAMGDAFDFWNAARKVRKP